MIKLSRRKFLGGVAAMAAAAPVVLPSILGERDMIAGFDLGSGDRTALVIGYADRGAIIVTDLITYGHSFERINLNGTIDRIDPRDVYLT